MNTKEIKQAASSALAEARGFRRWLANFADRHPNTAAGYIIGTFPFALYGVVKFGAWLKAVLS